MQNISGGSRENSRLDLKVRSNLLNQAKLSNRAGLYGVESIIAVPAPTSQGIGTLAIESRPIDRADSPAAVPDWMSRAPVAVRAAATRRPLIWGAHAGNHHERKEGVRKTDSSPPSIHPSFFPIGVTKPSTALAFTFRMHACLRPVYSARSSQIRR